MMRRRSKRESGGKQSNITVPEENGLHVFEHARKNMDKPNVWRGGPWYKNTHSCQTQQMRNGHAIAIKKKAITQRTSVV